MDYGKQIRQARKKLSLLQKDLVDSGVSRVHVTDLESGKSKLVAIKGLKIYEKLVFHAILNRISIDIDFSGLFSEGSKYYILHNAYGHVFEAMDLDYQVTDAALQQLEAYLLEEVDCIRYFILLTLGKIYSKRNEYYQAYSYFVDGLMLEKYRLTEALVNHFESSIEHFGLVASRLGRYDIVLDLYEQLLKYKQGAKIEVLRYTYYNLALFYKKNDDFVHADKYLKLQLETGKDNNENIIYELDTLRALIDMNLGKYDEGIRDFNIILIKVVGSDLYKEQISVYNNVINNILKFDLDQYEDLLYTCRDKLINFSESQHDLMKTRYKVFSNIGKTFMCQDDVNLAWLYFKKAFKAYESHTIKSNYSHLKLCIESYKAYKGKHKLNDLKTKLQRMDFEVLATKEQALYYRIAYNLYLDLGEEHMGELLKNIRI